MRFTSFAGALAVAAGLGVAPAASQNVAQDIDGLIAVLGQGGVVLYVRHAATETDYADQISAVMGDCSTQRMLSEQGWADARRIGRAIAAARIPVGDVLSSEYCRAWQTADLMFGRYTKTPALNFEPAEAYTDAQVAAMRGRVAPLIATEPDSVRVIVGHDDPFEAVTGLYPEPQGVAYVLRPGPDGPEVLGRIDPQDWPAE